MHTNNNTSCHAPVITETQSRVTLTETDNNNDSHSEDNSKFCSYVQLDLDI